MGNTKFILCPACGLKHEVEIINRTSKCIIKGIEVSYEETVFHCPNSNENDNAYFTNGKMLNDNLSKAREAYNLKLK